MRPLTDDQKHLLHLLDEGLTRQEIGERLHLTLAGVAARLGRLYRRLGASSRDHALYVARIAGLLEPAATRPAVVRVPLDPPEVIEARRRVLLGTEEGR